MSPSSRLSNGFRSFRPANPLLWFAAASQLQNKKKTVPEMLLYRPGDVPSAPKCIAPATIYSITIASKVAYRLRTGIINLEAFVHLRPRWSLLRCPAAGHRSWHVQAVLARLYSVCSPLQEGNRSLVFGGDALPFPKQDRERACIKANRVSKCRSSYPAVRHPVGRRAPPF